MIHELHNKEPMELLQGLPDASVDLIRLRPRLLNSEASEGLLSEAHRVLKETGAIISFGEPGQRDVRNEGLIGKEDYRLHVNRTNLKKSAVGTGSPVYGELTPVLVWLTNSSSTPDWKVYPRGAEELVKQSKVIKRKHKKDFEAASAELAAWIDSNELDPYLKPYRNIDAKGIYKLDRLPVRTSTKKRDELDSEGRLTGKGNILHVKTYYELERNASIPAVIDFPDDEKHKALFHRIAGPEGFGANEVYSEDPSLLAYFIEAMVPEDGTIVDPACLTGDVGHALLDLKSNRKGIMAATGGFYEDQAKARLESYASGQWMDWTYHKPLRDSFSFIDKETPTE